MSPRRAIITAIGCTALGAITSLAVAWGGACMPEPLYPSCGCCADSWRPSPREWVTMQLYDEQDTRATEGGPAYDMVAWRFGWPMRAVQAVWIDDGSRLGEGTVVGAIELPITTYDGIIPMPQCNLMLPVQPLPLGIAVNTATFALAWFTALVIPRAIRSILRRNRHRCIACGYALAGLPATAVCPECGHSYMNAHESPSPS